MPRHQTRRTVGTLSPKPEHLKCVSCGKTTRAQHAAILQGWYTGEDGARYCSWECVRRRVPKPKGRGRPLFVKLELQGATKAADVDHWMKDVLVPVLAELAADAALQKHDHELEGVRGVSRQGVIREFVITDYDRVLKLWKSCDGIVLRSADERAAIRRYLARNRGMSLVYEVGQEIVGAVLCGTDGRRGFLHHLAVASEHRRHGIGCTLVKRAVAALAQAGVHKCHLMVLPSNTAARLFWKSFGWQERSDVLVMSYTDGEKRKA